MLNRYIKFLIVLIGIFIITGCNNDNVTSSIDMEKYNTTDLQMISCVRKTETANNEKVDISFKVYYDEENDDKFLKILNSKEVVTSSDDNLLDEYERSYKNIYSLYDNIDYYDYSIKRKDNTVTVVSYINYGKINMTELMKIEGEEDNVKVTNGKIRLADWKSFAKKYGTSCK